MAIVDKIASWLMRKRIHQIELFMKYPFDVQEEWLLKLIYMTRDTEWGKRFGYAKIQNHEQFRQSVPLQNYESLKPFIERIRRGEQNLLWSEEIKWFAKSSGTTGEKSKFIPVSPHSLDGCHYNGGRDMVAIHCNNTPDTHLFSGKNLALGGSHRTDYYGNHESYNGDVSAIVIQNLPMWAEYFRAPAIDIALISDWEEKLDKMARATMEQNVTSVAGVPSWMLVLFRRIMEYKKVTSIKEVWPNLEVYFHGGVSFNPYRSQFQHTIGNEEVAYLQLYNASEGFFGIQYDRVSDEMLLMLDYGIYYEFIPSDEMMKENPSTISLGEVVIGEQYEMVISTSAGLWRYRLGDVIQFTSISPFKFFISGRTKNYINVFGEELMVHNVEEAVRIASEKTNALVEDFTVAPVFMDEKNTSGAHEWAIEFLRPPTDEKFFLELLDNALKQLNSDYEAKRFNNYVLKSPLVRIVTQGTFYRWQKSRNRLGGQNKIPRLFNDRKYMDELIRFIR
jgi:phenylacetate-coenzyme A ligase PaaK-like adenylate-forming protein